MDLIVLFKALSMEVPVPLVVVGHSQIAHRHGSAHHILPSPHSNSYNFDDVLVPS